MPVDIFTPTYALSQFMALIAFSAALASYHLKKKNQIFATNCAANVFDIAHYILLGGFSGAVVKVIALIRNILMTQQDKKEILKHIGVMVAFLVVYAVAAVLTFQSWYSLMPFVAAIVYMVVSWKGDTMTVKLIAVVCYIPWLIYNICIFSIVGIIGSFVSMLSVFGAYRSAKKEAEAAKDTWTIPTTPGTAKIVDSEETNNNTGESVIGTEEQHVYDGSVSNVVQSNKLRSVTNNVNRLQTRIQDVFDEEIEF